VGFNKDRGDSVNLIERAVRAGKGRRPMDVPLWRQPEVLDTARSLAWPLGTLAARGAGAAVACIRPALNDSVRAPVLAALTDAQATAAQLDALESDSQSARS